MTSASRLSSIALATVSLALGFAAQGQANTFYFIGGGTTMDWLFRNSNGIYSNWVAGVAPINSGAYDADIAFGLPDTNSSIVSNMNDAFMRARSLTFNSGRSTSLTGNQIRIAGGGTISARGLVSMANDILMNGDSSASRTLGVNVAAGAVLTATGSWSGNSSLIKQGLGTLYLTRSNSYSKGTTIQAGTLKIGAADAMTTGDLTISGGALDLNGFSPTVHNLFLGGSSDLWEPIQGTGTINLGSNVTFNGATVSSANFALGTGNHQFGGADTASLYTGVLAGVLSGPGSFEKVGTGSVVLLGSNTYNGSTTVTQGDLILGTTEALPVTTALTVAKNAFVYTSPPDSMGLVHAGSFDQTVASLAGEGYVVLYNSNLTLTGSATTQFTGSLFGPGSLILDGPGTLRFGASGSFDGWTILRSGTLRIQDGASLPGGVKMEGGTLDLDGRTLTIGNLEVGLGEPGETAKFTGGGAINLRGNVRFNSKSQAGQPFIVATPVIVSPGDHAFSGSALGRFIDLLFSGGVSGPGGLKVNFSNSVFGIALSGTNTYTGATTLASGGLYGLTTNAFSPFSAVTMNSDSHLHLNGYQYYFSPYGNEHHDQTIGSLSGNGTVLLGGATLTLGGLNTDTTFYGHIHDLTSSSPDHAGGKLVKVGSGNFTVSRPMEYVGNTEVREGTFAIASGGTVTGPISVSPGATLAHNVADPLFFVAPVVNQGKVLTSSGSRTVFQNTVSGRGSFVGSGAVEFAGEYRPGSGPGSILFEGDVIFSPSSHLIMALGGTSTQALRSHLDVDGTAWLGGTLSIDITPDFSTAAGSSFDLFDFAHQSGRFTQIKLPTLSGGLMWNTSGLYSHGVIRVQAVPEPASMVPLALGVLTMIRRERRKATRKLHRRVTQ